MPKTITSLQNARVKRATRLRDRRHRDRRRRIVIDGVRELGRAIDAGVELEEAFLCPELCTGDDARRLISRLADAGTDMLYVTPAVFGKLAFGDRAEGVVGIAPTPTVALADWKLPEQPLAAVVEAIEKPGNLGAVLRSADAAGVSAVIVADGRTDLYNPNVIRASLGTVFTLPVWAASSREALDWLRTQGAKIFAARVDGRVRHTDADYTGSAAIVLGSEADGLSDLWRADDVTAVRLPMLGAADSLNISAAAAVLFYEALRQRAGTYPTQPSHSNKCSARHE